MSGNFGERIVMVCQLCGSPHHDQPKEVHVQDPKTGAWGRKRCPLCVCLDCVQTHNDPVRQHLRPLMMGQTLNSQYNLDVEEFDKGKGHTEPVRKRLTIKAPGPLNVPEAIKAMGEFLGLAAPEPSKRHRIAQATACACGKNATSKCISCDVPLCMKCLKAHECED